MQQRGKTEAHTYVRMFVHAHPDFTAKNHGTVQRTTPASCRTDDRATPEICAEIGKTTPVFLQTDNLLDYLKPKGILTLS